MPTLHQEKHFEAELAEYLATKLTQLRPEEASAARVLRELLKNQRM